MGQHDLTPEECEALLRMARDTLQEHLTRSTQTGRGAGPDPGGRLLELAVLDVGSGRIKRKVSRSLAGPAERQRATLAIILTEAFFPERVVGRIALRIDPPGARVLLDGQPRVDPAPALVNLENVPEGRHTVQVQLAGYLEFIAFVQVPYQGVSQLDVKLRKTE